MEIRIVRLGRGLAAAGLTVGLALGAAACNDDNSGAGTAGPAGATAASSTAASSTAASGTAVPSKAAPSAGRTAGPAGGGTGGGRGGSQPSSAAAAGSRCHTDELRADVQLQPDFPGNAMVMLVNKGTRTCTVDGYLGYGGLAADNSRVDLTTNRVAYPGAPIQVALEPGATAFSGLKWSSCDKADAGCEVLAGLVVTPPDETTRLTADVLGVDGQAVPQLTVSAAGLTVGSLQPSNQGVVFG
ncbi:DUF4232 domain-containing protein [Kitasatospora sp. RB6PN24]|uniref:DUF4232 domain-containing protein n=1 Tax=Kitasatospora humi TaxID=2893891 RepID=UPI001E4E99EC|nr:DUF4232 domain-containing protein [Kitasatospora humi]MCC9311773.1 DUF4232 domain-containing protein [Kitasatospora humi]